MSALDKCSFKGSCGNYDKNILNCFSGKGINLRKEIARYADVIIILRNDYLK